jgi:hypothetical protein
MSEAMSVHFFVTRAHLSPSFSTVSNETTGRSRSGKRTIMGQGRSCLVVGHYDWQGTVLMCKLLFIDRKEVDVCPLTSMSLQYRACSLLGVQEEAPVSHFLAMRRERTFSLAALKRFAEFLRTAPPASILYLSVPTHRGKYRAEDIDFQLF